MLLHRAALGGKSSSAGICLYGYGDDVTRFHLFSKAAVEFLVKSNKRPEVIHCHDWQAGLVPVLLYEQYAA